MASLRKTAPRMAAGRIAVSLIFPLIFPIFTHKKRATALAVALDLFSGDTGTAVGAAEVTCFRTSFRDAMPSTLRLPRRFAPRNDTKNGRFYEKPTIFTTEIFEFVAERHRYSAPLGAISCGHPAVYHMRQHISFSRRLNIIAKPMQPFMPVEHRSQLAGADGAREGQHVADVADAGQIHHAALKAEAEARVARRAILAQVEVEGVVLLL